MKYDFIKIKTKKIVGVNKGEAIDVIVDVRPDSPTFRKWLGIKLKPYENQLIVPKGFAHGFLTLSDNVTFCYEVDEFYSKELEDNFLWNDPEINIDWEFEKYGIENVDDFINWFNSEENQTQGNFTYLKD